MIPAPSHPAPVPSRAEGALLAGLTAAFLLACLGPFVPQHPDYHPFADQRTLWGLPCALDVLTNLPFALAGLWGLLLLARLARALPANRLGHALALPALFCVGLLATAAGSAAYHLHPDDAGLAWDRAGMAVAFAGLLGWAVADRISLRAGLLLAPLLLAAGLAAIAVWRLQGNLLAWSVLQGGGMLLLLTLAPLGGVGVAPVRPVRALPLLPVIALYALSKALEWGDTAVFDATSGLISGHSLKHLAAAAAALSPLLAVQESLRSVRHSA